MLTPVSTDRKAFLKQNEVERQKLDREIAQLERKLGAKDSKKRRKLNDAIETEGFGTGFMDFIDGIEGKLGAEEEAYEPKEYVFSDGEGVEEGDMVGFASDDSDQEGFDDLESEDEAPVPVVKGGKKHIKREEESEEDEEEEQNDEDDEENEDDGEELGEDEEQGEDDMFEDDDEEMEEEGDDEEESEEEEII